MEYTNINTNSPGVMSQIQSLANSAFGKGLASVIMAEFPILCFIAIFLGGSAASRAKSASALALQNGVSAGGKCVAAKILGTIGMILGIIMSLFWVLYIIIIIIAVIGSAM